MKFLFFTLVFFLFIGTAYAQDSEDIPTQDLVHEINDLAMTVKTLESKIKVLESQEFVTTWIPIIVNIVMATILAFTFLSNKRSLNENSKLNALKLMKEFEQDIAKFHEMEAQLKTKEDCFEFAYRYLGTLSQISYFISKKYVTDEFVNFLRGYFSHGAALLKWLSVMEHHDVTNRFPEIFHVVTKFDIQSESLDHLHPTMVNFSKEWNQTYLNVEHALTITDTEKIDQNYSEMQKDNHELRGIVDNLSRQLQNLEKKIEIKNKTIIQWKRLVKC